MQYESDPVVSIHDIAGDAWRNIFGFLRCGDLLQFARSAHACRNLIASLVENLEVETSSHLLVSTAKVFLNVQVLKVSCFVSPVAAAEADEHGTCTCGEKQTLNEDAILRLPFFLNQLPKLSKARFYGTYHCICDKQDYHLYYDPDKCVSDGHQELMRGFMRALAGGFATGGLSSSLFHLQGLRCPLAFDSLFDVHRESEENSAGCKECRLLHSSVPSALNVETPASFCGWQVQTDLVPEWMSCMTEKTIFQLQMRNHPATSTFLSPENWALSLLASIDTTQTWCTRGIGYHPEVLDALAVISSQATVDSTLALRRIEQAIDEFRCGGGEAEDPSSFGLARDCHRRLIDMGMLSPRDTIELTD